MRPCLDRIIRIVSLHIVLAFEFIASHSLALGTAHYGVVADPLLYIISIDASTATWVRYMYPNHVLI